MENCVKQYQNKFIKSGNLFHGYFNKISDKINKIKNIEVENSDLTQPSQLANGAEDDEAEIIYKKSNNSRVNSDENRDHNSNKVEKSIKTCSIDLNDYQSNSTSQKKASKQPPAGKGSRKRSRKRTPKLE